MGDWCRLSFGPIGPAAGAEARAADDHGDGERDLRERAIFQNRVASLD